MIYLGNVYVQACSLHSMMFWTVSECCLGIDSPTKILSHHLSLAMIAYHLFFLAHHYSIHSTVFLLVRSSIKECNTGHRYTCISGLLHAINSPFYTPCRILLTKYLLFPPHKILVSKSAGFSLPSICVVRGPSIAIV